MQFEYILNLGDLTIVLYTQNAAEEKQVKKH